MVARQGVETRVVVDTEAGPVETIARSEGDRVCAVTLRWTPSFVALADQVVEVDGVGELPLDIAVGVGNVFAVVDAARAGVAVRREHTRTLAHRGMAVRDPVHSHVPLEFPGLRKTQPANVPVHDPPH